MVDTGTADSRTSGLSRTAREIRRPSRGADSPHLPPAWPERQYKSFRPGIRRSSTFALFSSPIACRGALPPSSRRRRAFFLTAFVRSRLAAPARIFGCPRERQIFWHTLPIRPLPAGARATWRGLTALAAYSKRAGSTAALRPARLISAPAADPAHVIARSPNRPRG